ncbi:hypothetical protein BAUCODRAFT_31370 [Baudoinia panamericana UAMH 10762]|uniref:Protein kinase domain-containing protein n=1 Tax=Baudoinia panamericana (strain UAMH 10762) TaxID=717646 RepID=M2LWP3_BAUPA|nr:uncharacterized protein BAUCODRAFT_31370 [Baudoinia panamericana UAMH 10762]EMC99082.1 hypothetical protein BAUCODRAFT_31370 [Baudoinia panamericana UAMH 10762]
MVGGAETQAQTDEKRTMHEGGGKHLRAGDGGEGSLVQDRQDGKQIRDEQSSQQEIQRAVSVSEAALNNHHAIAQNIQASSAALPSINTALAPAHASLPHRSPYHLSPPSAGLRLQPIHDARRSSIDDSPSDVVLQKLQKYPTIYETSATNEFPLGQNLTSPIQIPGFGSALRSTLSTASLTSSVSSSTLPSPYLAAMTDLTPLPSPLGGVDFPGPNWRRALAGARSRQSSLTDDSTPISGRPSSLPTSPESPPGKRKKPYGNLAQEAVFANAVAAQDHQQQVSVFTTRHGRNRSISDFVPEALHNLRPRHVTFGPGDVATLEAQEYRMHREEYLAAQRGLIAADCAEKRLPTPPPSTGSIAESDEADDERPYLEDGTETEYLEIHCGIHNKRRKFRQLRQLGQGTFSTVMLATTERVPAHPTPEIEDMLDPHKLVAVKVVGYGPAGGADEERIETSLKREVEMLKCVSHPSLIHLKACEYQSTRALLVLTYCPGGDLFELASQKREFLTPPMVQRMFAELVGAVRYLHTHWIVHRDIKLENVLVNMPTPALQEIDDPLTFPTPIVTLTDLGLSRRVPQPPESPLLSTRCGSEDYAAPEILLGQPYDGRQTDAWALGVLLYALMEGRLPFDAPPGKPDRSRNTHRIARCDWIWCRFGDEDGEWDSTHAQGFEGARPCVEGLLKKVRMGRKPLEDIEKMPYVHEGIRVEGGLQMRESEDDDML